MMAGADAFKITVTGSAAHGSTPEKGKNALEGSIRTFETESRNFMKKRLQEISAQITISSPVERCKAKSFTGVRQIASPISKEE